MIENDWLFVVVNKYLSTDQIVAIVWFLNYDGPIKFNYYEYFLNLFICIFALMAKNGKRIDVF